jgi:AraC-like DNA-binding protein
MVCDRCIRVVREELERLGLDVRTIRLGEAVVRWPAGAVDKEAIRRTLEANGFELLDDRRSRLVEKTRQVILQIARGEREHRRRGWKDSAIIEREVGLDYRYLSTLFSSLQGITIEQYIILQRIERVKELLRYDELSLKEIAFSLGYSSIAHLSNQFKNVTGLTPTQFKKLAESTRVPLDAVGRT